MKTMYEVAFEIPAIQHIGFVFVDDYNTALNWYLHYTEHIAEDLSFRDMRPNAVGKPAFMAISQFETDKPQSFFDELNVKLDKNNKEHMDFMKSYESPDFKRTVKLDTILSGMPKNQFDNLFTYTYAVVAYLTTEIDQKQKDAIYTDVVETLFGQRGIVVSNIEDIAADINTCFGVLSEKGEIIVNEFSDIFEAMLDEIAPQGPFIMTQDGKEISVAELMRNSVPYDSEER